MDLAHTDASNTKPFLRWAGSKRKQLKYLRPFWTKDYKRYVEPFCGSACFFFALNPSNALLSDNNPALIELFRVVRDQPEQLYKRLVRIKRDLPTYMRWRDKNPANLDKETRALRFFYLNRNCFNGIYRTNLAGKFNVPMGSISEYPTLQEIKACSEMLHNATLLAADFDCSIERVQKGDLVYLDPPYAASSVKIFREYTEKSFSTFDIPRLAEGLKRIDAAGATFVVSYAECNDIDVITHKWNHTVLPIRRNVAGFAGARKIDNELLITNRDIPFLDNFVNL